MESISYRNLFGASVKYKKSKEIWSIAASSDPGSQIEGLICVEIIFGDGIVARFVRLEH